MAPRERSAYVPLFRLPLTFLFPSNTLETNITVFRVQPELIVLPLRLPVQVYSGIAPPPALVQAMRDAANNPPSTSTPTTAPPIRPTPQSAGDAGGDLPDVAPPSYEEAMAQDIGPLDGRRRDYQDGDPRPRPSNESADGRPGDAKGGGLRREGTLRLNGEGRGGPGGGNGAGSAAGGTATQRP